MKNFLFILFLFPVCLFAQATNSQAAADDEEYQFFIACDAIGFSGTHPTFTGTLSTVGVPNQIGSYPFILSNAQVDDVYGGGTGALYEIVSISSNTGSVLTGTFKRITTNPDAFVNTLAPASRGALVRPNALGLLPAPPENASGISPVVEALFRNYNLQRISNAITNLSVSPNNLNYYISQDAAKSTGLVIGDEFKYAKGSTEGKWGDIGTIVQ